MRLGAARIQWICLGTERDLTELHARDLRQRDDSGRATAVSRRTGAEGSSITPTTRDLRTNASVTVAIQESTDELVAAMSECVLEPAMPTRPPRDL
jgi:hypothetical protein